MSIVKEKELNSIFRIELTLLIKALNALKIVIAPQNVAPQNAH